MDEQDAPDFDGQRDRAFSTSTINVKRADYPRASAGATSNSFAYPAETQFPEHKVGPRRSPNNESGRVHVYVTKRWQIIAAVLPLFPEWIYNRM
jgi:hypothetical protein